MNKLDRLKKILAGYESAVVAFSGGADSSFLLNAAADTLAKKNVLAVTAASDTYTGSELAQAKKIAKGLGVKHKVIHTYEMDNSDFVRNSPDRCYYCKKELFRRLSDVAKKGGYGFILDASNIDDKKDYRPGSRAKKEFGVKSPLQEAGITKSDVRKYSRKMGLKTWDLPATACLASRVPYGEKISRTVLKKIEKAESVIKRMGVDHVRVRYHSDIARIEVDKKDIKRFFNQGFCDKIVRHLKIAGFKYVSLDLEGYRTGSLNEVLKQNSAA